MSPNHDSFAQLYGQLESVQDPTTRRNLLCSWVSDLLQKTAGDNPTLRLLRLKKIAHETPDVAVRERHTQGVLDEDKGFYSLGAQSFEFIPRKKESRDFRAGKGQNSKVFLTRNGVLKLTKKPLETKKLLLSIWVTYVELPRAGIPSAEVFDFDPYGIYLLQEHVEFPEINLECAYSFKRKPPPPTIVQGVLKLYRLCKRMAQTKGVYLDLNAGNCIPRGDQLVNIDTAPFVGKKHYVYFQKHENGPWLSDEDFLKLFFFHRISLKYFPGEVPKGNEIKTHTPVDQNWNRWRSTVLGYLQ